MVMKPPYQGNVIYFPHKKAHFFPPLPPFTTSLRNSWALEVGLAHLSACQRSRALCAWGEWSHCWCHQSTKQGSGLLDE